MNIKFGEPVEHSADPTRGQRTAAEIDSLISSHEEAIRALKSQRDEAAKRLRESVRPVHRITVSPVEGRRYERIWDDQITHYEVRGEITNVEELKAAGWSDHQLHQGGMVWLFNKATKRLIGAFGGGSVFLGGHSFGSMGGEVGRVKDALEIAAVSQFIVNNPDGGEITHLLSKYSDQ